MKFLCTVPNGTKGPWTIDEFTISEHAAAIENVRQLLRGEPDMVVAPGRYKRLRHKTRGVVMSTTPMEQRTNERFVRRAFGEVLINGLGLGMVLETILDNKWVTHVTVVEVDKDVIDLVGPHFERFCKEDLLTIEHASAFDWEPPEGVRFDVVWHDIWDTIGPNNMLEFAQLCYKYKSRAGWQGCWSEEMVRARMKDEYRKKSWAALHPLFEADKAKAEEA